MSTLTDELERPEFETVNLDITAEEAHRHIDDTVAGLSPSEDSDQMKIRTTGGMLVAIIAARDSERGGVKSTLAYRTEPASDPATRKAKKLAEALRPYEIPQ